MPFYDDHPVRALMRRHGVSRAQLSKTSGVTYAAIDKLMMGMTKTVHPDVAAALARLTGTAPKTIHREVERWNGLPLLEKLPPRARATLAFEPADIPVFYPSFQAWREEFAENPTQFASLVRVPRATLVEYETGRRKIFPPTLRERIIVTFQVDEGYVDALVALPPTDQASFDPTVRIVTVPTPAPPGIPYVEPSGSGADRG